MTTKLKLVARAKKGDADAFQALIHEEKEKLYKMAYVYMRNEDDALEVFQETVYKTFESIATLKNNRLFFYMDDADFNQHGDCFIEKETKNCSDE